MTGRLRELAAKTFRPAYSGAFADHHLVRCPPLDPVELLTPEWAWGGSEGEGVKVAVVDSGVDASHPDVGTVDGYVAITEGDDLRFVYDTAPHDDAFGHGTACAGIIRSLAPRCELYSVKVLGGANKGKGRVFAAGIRWAIDNGMHVCNLSLGTTKRDCFSIFHELADEAYFRNIILVTAANNMPVPSYPSVYSSVISVASHGVPDPHVFYYNPNPPVEFGALGIDVSVAWQGHTRRTMTANSYASPHMTGVVAQILAKHPGLTVFQLKTILRELAANVDRQHVAAPPPLLGAKPPQNAERV